MAEKVINPTTAAVFAATPGKAITGATFGVNIDKGEYKLAVIKTGAIVRTIATDSDTYKVLECSVEVSTDKGSVTIPVTLSPEFSGNIGDKVTVSVTERTNKQGKVYKTATIL